MTTTVESLVAGTWGASTDPADDWAIATPWVSRQDISNPLDTWTLRTVIQVFPSQR